GRVAPNSLSLGVLRLFCTFLCVLRAFAVKFCLSNARTHIWQIQTLALRSHILLREHETQYPCQ
ncbi:MAG: hypothetical protein SGJ03_02635, partial [Alphaproteobacteria bacterium]|nr:hypothetical protein [Alphaproteobacteria bacterium]